MALLSAYAVQGAVSVGPEWVVNDPFVRRSGLRGGVLVRFPQKFGFSTNIAGYPNFGRRDWTRLTQDLVNADLPVQLSRILGQVRLDVEFAPLEWEYESLTTNLLVGVGVGGAYTRDDLEVAKREDAEARRTEVQVLPAWTWTVGAELRVRRVGLRMRVSQTRYNEEFGGEQFPSRPVWLGADALFWFGVADP